MILRAKLDVTNLRALTIREKKRLAFNVALALNETAKQIQKAERDNLDRRLVIRKAGFMQRLIKITQFASATRGVSYAEIAIDPTKDRVLLGKLERGGAKEPEMGASVAVPLTGGPARPSFGHGVKPSLQIGKLSFAKHTTAGGKTQWKGEKRTFIIPKIGIFQRTGKRLKRRGRKKFKGLREATPIKLLYAFKKHPRLRAMLHFIATATQVFERIWLDQLRKAYKKPT